LSWKSFVIRITGRPSGSRTEGSRSRKLSSYDSTSSCAPTPATESAFCASHAFQLDPQRATLGGVAFAVPIGFASIVALHIPPPMKPRPLWSKLSASRSSNAAYWPSVPL
jgi:hypothetical protein